MRSGLAIDSATTIDRDDAIWAEKTVAGYRLSVFVADVSALVRMGSLVDEQARERLETLYRSHSIQFMLPRGVQDLASLDKGKVRSVLTIDLEFDVDLNMLSAPKLSFGKVKTADTFAHKEVANILRDPEHKWYEQLVLCSSLAQSLLANRRDQGAMALYDLNNGWVTTEDGFVHQLKDVEDTIGYVIIQEFMILANAAIANYAAEHELPILFRNHTAKAHAACREEIQNQMAAAFVAPETLDVFRKRTHLLLNKADYGQMLGGHYGLNLPAYTHCTSPIRRYADLVTQRQLEALLCGRELPYTREEISILAAHINETLVARKEAAGDFFRSRANKLAESRLCKPRTLKYIEAKDFERVLKVMIESGEDPTEGMVEAFQYRLAKRLLNPGDLRIVLLLAPGLDDWQKLSQAVIEHLVGRPHSAIAVANIAVQSGDLEDISYTSRKTGTGHRPIFFVIAQSGDTKTDEVAATSLKAAKQRATICLLAKRRDLTGPTWEVPDSDEDVKKARPASRTDNAVAALQEYCQQNNLDLPHYEFKQRGDSHTPTFVCTCEAVGRKKTASASGRKGDAKRAAAAAIIEALEREK